jgi:hypothetical protein
VYNSNVSNVGFPYVPTEEVGPPPSLPSEMLSPWINASRYDWATIRPLIEPALNENNVSSVQFELSPWPLNLSDPNTANWTWTLSVKATLYSNQTLGMVTPVSFPGKLQYPANISVLNALLGISSRPDFSADESSGKTSAA